MNTMNMPGFTAEASLWNTTGRHYIGVSRALSASSRTVSLVEPSLRVLPPLPGGGDLLLGGFWCYAACVAGCTFVPPPADAACILGCAQICS